MNEPYFVEVDCNGCSKCGALRTWTIIGPEGDAYHTSFDDEEDAAAVCDALNQAFDAGRNEKQREMRRARRAVEKVIIPPADGGGKP